MALFNFFNGSSKNPVLPNQESDNLQPENFVRKDVPEDIFVAKEEIEREAVNESKSAPKIFTGIDEIFDFLNENYEEKGYEDAMANPEQSYMDLNIDILKSRLHTKIMQVKLKYQDYLKDINFHIETRSRIGLIEIVEELNIRKESMQNHLIQIEQLALDLEKQSGSVEQVLLSYKRGFLRGISAITHNLILERKF